MECYEVILRQALCRSSNLCNKPIRKERLAMPEKPKSPDYWARNPSLFCGRKSAKARESNPVVLPMRLAGNSEHSRADAGLFVTAYEQPRYPSYTMALQKRHSLHHQTPHRHTRHLPHCTLRNPLTNRGNPKTRSWRTPRSDAVGWLYRELYMHHITSPPSHIHRSTIPKPCRLSILYRTSSKSPFCHLTLSFSRFLC